MEHEVREAAARYWQGQFRDVLHHLTPEAQAIIHRQVDLAFQRGIAAGKERTAQAIWALA